MPHIQCAKLSHETFAQNIQSCATLCSRRLTTCVLGRREHGSSSICVFCEIGTWYYFCTESSCVLLQFRVRYRVFNHYDLSLRDACAIRVLSVLLRTVHVHFDAGALGEAHREYPFAWTYYWIHCYTPLLYSPYKHQVQHRSTINGFTLVIPWNKEIVINIVWMCNFLNV